LKETNISGNDSRTRRGKAKIREALLSKDIDSLLSGSDSDTKLLRALMSLLYDPDRLICFRAAHALGKVSAAVAKRDASKIRNLLRRLLWTMNDESGSICWFAPEAIAEILVCNPQFMREFCLILLAFTREEPFEAGVHRALYRVAESNKDSFPIPAGRFEVSLDDDDPSIRGYTLLIYLALHAAPPGDRIRKTLSDQSEFLFFNDASLELETMIISEIARRFEQSPSSSVRYVE